MHATLLADLREGRNDWQNIQEVIRTTIISVIKMVDQSFEKCEQAQRRGDLLAAQNKAVFSHSLFISIFLIRFYQLEEQVSKLAQDCSALESSNRAVCLRKL